MRLDFKITLSIISCLQEKYLKFKDTNRLKLNDGKRYIIQTTIIKELEWLC